MPRTRGVPEGGTLGVFAGSGPYDPDRFEAGVARLEERGFRVVRAPGIDARLGFLAGTDEARAAGIAHLLDRPDVDALIAARGGYGLTRLLDRLDPVLFLRSAKPVVGFSDVTALHTLLLSHGLDTIHGPVVSQLGGLPEEDLDALMAALRGARTGAICAEGPVLVPGRAEGPVWGGNLAVLTALVGTASLRLPDDGVLLLLEDVGESTYRLDRLLTQLGSAGLLRRARGVLLGDFIDCNPAQPGHPEALEVLRERLEIWGIPVLAGFPVGHGARNMTIPLGRRAVLDTSSRSLEVLE